jgi:phospholipid-binding lipoprotein MlaA
MNFRPLIVCLTVSVAVFLGGCATATGGGRGGSDPLEPANRVVAGFNFMLDKYLVQPAAQGYKFAVPQVIQNMVGNFFSNLDDVWVGANNLMQGKPKAAFSDVSRFTINTVFGLLGTLDIASEMGLKKNREDFGQTLAVWGVPPGPYIVLPILGPSSLRDSAALILDSKAALLPYAFEDSTARIAAYGLRAIDTRAGFLSASKFIDSASYDDYTFFRNGFFQRRYSQVFDGNPPDKAAPTYDDDDEKDPPKNETKTPAKGAAPQPVDLMDAMEPDDKPQKNPAQ